jgi:hypothetical protein
MFQLLVVREDQVSPLRDLSLPTEEDLPPDAVLSLRRALAKRVLVVLG